MRIVPLVGVAAFQLTASVRRVTGLGSNTGRTISTSGRCATRPQMMAMASGCCIPEPCPIPKASGRSASTAAMVVIRIGRIRLRAAWINAGHPLYAGRQFADLAHQEDGNLRGDAHDHRQAHHGGDVEFGARDPQAEEDDGQREQRREQDGRRRLEALVHVEQQQEDQRRRRAEDEQQPGESRLLFGVPAAQHERHLARQQAGPVQGRLHVADRRAQVAPAQPPRDGDHAPQVLARDFRLADQRADGGDLPQREKVAVGGADGQVAELARAGAVGGAQDHPHGDGLGVADDLRIGRTGQRV